MCLKPVRCLGWIVVIGAAGAAPLAAQTPPSFDPPRPGVDASRFLPDGGFAEGDGHRTVAAFPKNVGRGLLSVFRTSNVGPLLIGASLAGTSNFFDERAQGAFGGKAPGFGSMGQKAGSATTMIPVTLGLFVAGRASSNSRFRAATYDMAESLAVTTIYTAGLKQAVQRQRPDGSDRLSFPSGHTANTFALASVANTHYGPKVGIPAFALASAIGLSRVEHGKHNVSDVLAGATLGFVVGRSVAHDNGVAPRGRSTRFALTPSTDARGGGMGAGFSLSW
jgi:membrane-associated phospholipid phosphatase